MTIAPDKDNDIGNDDINELKRRKNNNNNHEKTKNKNEPFHPGEYDRVVSIHEDAFKG